jgi:hypothetical protein
MRRMPEDTVPTRVDSRFSRAAETDVVTPASRARSDPTASAPEVGAGSNEVRRMLGC